MPSLEIGRDGSAKNFQIAYLTNIGRMLIGRRNMEIVVVIVVDDIDLAFPYA